MTRRLINGTFYGVCYDCGKIVKDKLFLGTTHICTTQEERLMYRPQINLHIQESERILQDAK